MGALRLKPKEKLQPCDGSSTARTIATDLAAALFYFRHHGSWLWQKHKKDSAFAREFWDLHRDEHPATRARFAPIALTVWLGKDGQKLALPGVATCESIAMIHM